ncbi:ComEC/Rec2 family competence protein [Planctomycetales bacterium ZRK34]|nr:ComEC/Rec2 family competence protein [Planctomycetales bacterium ZRK34]
MNNESPPTDQAPKAVWPYSPLVWAAVCWVIGLMLGSRHDEPAAWLAGAVATLGIGGVLCFCRHHRTAIGLVGASVVCAAAVWWSLDAGRDGVWGLKPSTTSRLVRIEGVVEGDIFRRTQASGSMGRFDYRGPATKFIVRADRVCDEQGWRDARVGVLVDVSDYDGRVHPGDRVRCIGWLASFRQAANPGEGDFAQMMRRQGVVGRLAIKARGNCQIIEEADHPLTRARNVLIRGATMTLDYGMPDQASQTNALLHTLLLGDRRQQLGDLDEAFRDAGLAHLLAISGLHLGILVAGTWWLASWFTGRPRWAAIVAIATVLLYITIVPPRVPILRAAVMTVVGCWAMTLGHRISAVAAMALAGMALLIWRPSDVFSAGFQLSFTVVAGLVIFAGPIAARWFKDPLLDRFGTGSLTLRRYGLDYLAVTITAWSVSLPLVAYHFHAISPAGLVMALVMLPVMAVVLWLGYFKMLLTAVWPGGGAVVGVMLHTAGEWTGELVETAARTPGAAITVAQPSALWAVATMAVVAALLAGWFRRRWIAGMISVLICVVWIAGPTIAQRQAGAEAALRVNMFAVGDGSCFLLRSGDQTMMFDCGSSNYFDITSVAIGPALRTLGVKRIDTLVLSHPDTDHFSGTLELVDRFEVGRVITTQAFYDEADERPWTAARFLLDELEQRGKSAERVAAGWQMTLGEAEVEAIWPPGNRRFERNNDASLVLLIRAGRRRVLLCGDAQHEAITSMLQAGVDVKADVLELPHHGSFIDVSPQWLTAVSPEVAMQSSGFARLRYDPWPPYLAGITRCVTARHGMVEVRIQPDGTLQIWRFLDDMEPVASPNIK